MVFFITLFYFCIDFFAITVALNVSSHLWYVTLLITVLAFLMAIPGKFYNSKTLMAMLMLPKAFYMMFLLLFKLKGANTKFIHTKHGTVHN
jgi:hypothetical protein